MALTVNSELNQAGRRLGLPIHDFKSGPVRVASRGRTGRLGVALSDHRIIMMPARKNGASGASQNKFNKFSSSPAA